MTDKALYRILDANFNRAREGLRVAEEVVRFGMESSSLQKSLKACRHEVQRALEGLEAAKTRKLLASRDSRGDVGRGASRLEERRADLAAVFSANIQRAKESLRALEEFLKLVDAGASRRLKEVRFRVYVIEKRALPKLDALRHHLSDRGGSKSPQGRRGRA